MKYLIEEYKGQTIEYDDNLDKFVCNISIEDKNKSTKRQSLKTVKDEIDQFVKLNVNFKKFKAISYGTYWNVGKVVEVSAIRKDGTFVVEDGTTYKSYLTAKQLLDSYRAYDPDATEELNRIDKARSEVEAAYKEAKTEIMNNLKPIDLSQYINLIGDINSKGGENNNEEANG